MAQLNEKELFESVPVPKAVARLIVPTIIRQIVTVIYNLADTFFIGRIDALFANAGIMPAGNMSELKTGDWARMVEINIMGVLNSMAAVLPRFIAQKRGHIVVTSSVAGTRSVPGNAVYCGTKHFVRAMLESFRAECVAEGTNIRTTAIFPGAVKTELLNTVAPSETKAMVEKFYETVGISPAAVANAVLYALSQPDDVDVSELTIRPSREA